MQYYYITVSRIPYTIYLLYNCKSKYVVIQKNNFGQRPHFRFTVSFADRSYDSYDGMFCVVLYPFWCDASPTSVEKHARHRSSMMWRQMKVLRGQFAPMPSLQFLKRSALAVWTLMMRLTSWLATTLLYLRHLCQAKSAESATRCSAEMPSAGRWLTWCIGILLLLQRIVLYIQTVTWLRRWSIQMKTLSFAGLERASVLEVRRTTVPVPPRVATPAGSHPSVQQSDSTQTQTSTSVLEI